MNLYAYVFDNPLSWVDPLGLDVTVSQWKCCGGFNHIGIGVNTADTVGFYPQTPHSPIDIGVVVPDRARNPQEVPIDHFTIRTTPQQDQRIQEYIEQRRLNPGLYNLGGRHCGTFVQEALRHGGIDPYGDVASPRGFYEGLKALSNSGVDFTEGYNRP